MAKEMNDEALAHKLLHRLKAHEKVMHKQIIELKSIGCHLAAEEVKQCCWHLNNAGEAINDAFEVLPFSEMEEDNNE